MKHEHFHKGHSGMIKVGRAPEGDQDIKTTKKGSFDKKPVASKGKPSIKMPKGGC